MAPWGATVPLVPELRFGAAGLGRRRISRPPDASVSRGGGVWERLRCGCRWHRECCGWCAAMRAAAWLWALGRFVDAGWQHSRAVHDSRGPCSESGPFMARSSRGVFPNGCLQGFSDAWRAYLAKASSFRMHGAHILPKPAHFGCMARESCHELAIFPSETAFGMHGAQNLPWIAARERISRAFCHRRTPGNASRHNLATTGRPRRTLRAPMRYDTMRHDAMRRSTTTPRAATP